MDKYDIYEVYRAKLVMAKSNIIALKNELREDTIDDESGVAWSDVIDMLDEVESALIRANAELERVVHY